MTHDSVRREFGEGDFANEVWRHPIGVTSDVARRVLERIGLARAGVERFLDGGGVPDVPPSTDATVIDEFALVPAAQQQRGEAFSSCRMGASRR